MSLDSLELTVGDTSPTLAGAVNADLTGATAVVHIKRPDRTVISRNATIAPGSSGAWLLAFIVGDLTVRGIYYVELQVTFAGGAIQTFSKVPTGQPGAGQPTTFYVRDQIA